MSRFPFPTGRTRTIVLAILAAVLVIASLVAWKTWHDTMGDPQVLRTTVTLADMPDGTDPVTVALLTDIHVSGPDMPPKRLENEVLSRRGLISRLYK